MADRRDALIIATGGYEHVGLRDLRSAAADASALAEVLSDPAIGGFAVDVLRDGTAHEMRARVEDFFADRRPGDVLLLHLSCHGLKGESGELYFTARDTRPQRLASTAVSADFVQQCLRMSRSRSIVVLLDCCYGGAFGKGVRVRAAGDIPVMDSFPTGSKGSGRGRAVITASSSMEYAFEGDELADDHTPTPSVFTSALVEGLRTGEADLDGDGLVSLDELYDYVYDRVRERNPAQTPTKDIEMSGDLYLARSRQRARVPAELLAALAEPNVYTRVGAVTGLRQLLVGNDVAVARAARAELERIAGQDVPQVAEAARAALRELVVVPATRMIELTPATPGRLLRLDGPPLARAVSWQVSDPRIMVQPMLDGLQVSVEPEQSVRGEIRLGDGTAIEVTATGTRRRRSDPLPAVPSVRLRPARVVRMSVGALFGLLSVVLAIIIFGGGYTAILAIGVEVLAYAALRLVEVFTTDVSAARRRWMWGLCGFGMVAGTLGFLSHIAGLFVLFWALAALIELFGRPIDRIRGAVAGVVAVSTITVLSVMSGQQLDFVADLLHGFLALLLGLITLASVLPRWNR